MEYGAKGWGILVLMALLMAGFFLIGYALISQDSMLQQDMEEYVDLAGQVQFPQPDPAKNAGSEGAS